MIIITTIAASILGLLYIKLSLNVIKHRRKHGVSVGDGGENGLLMAIRAQANLAEYAPIGIILIACLELNSAPWMLTTLLATIFTMGRILHPLGMVESNSPHKARVRGMQLTLLGILALVIGNIAVIVWSLL